jgi:hypothetical protein
LRLFGTDQKRFAPYADHARIVHGSYLMIFIEGRRRPRKVRCCQTNIGAPLSSHAALRSTELRPLRK